eukprot:7977064-Pyramimonas_sp.AAC.1
MLARVGLDERPQGLVLLGRVLGWVAGGDANEALHHRPLEARSEALEGLEGVGAQVHPPGEVL